MRAHTVLAPPFKSDDQITLDETDRNRRRIRLTSAGGTEFLLDLEEARLLKHGEGLLLEDGRIIEVRAEAEALYRVRATSPHHLIALAWQLGNRHLPTEILETELRIRRDHVIRDMLIGLGATVEDIVAPFDPESGAYRSGHHHSDHSHTQTPHRHD